MQNENSPTPFLWKLEHTNYDSWFDYEFDSSKKEMGEQESAK